MNPVFEVQLINLTNQMNPWKKRTVVIMTHELMLAEAKPENPPRGDLKDVFCNKNTFIPFYLTI